MCLGSGKILVMYLWSGSVYAVYLIRHCVGYVSLYQIIYWLSVCSDPIQAICPYVGYYQVAYCTDCVSGQVLYRLCVCLGTIQAIRLVRYYTGYASG